MVIAVNETETRVEETVADRKRAEIPVRNWWHMLLYAWDLVELEGLFDSEWEDAPDLHELLTLILVDLVNRQVRRGLRGDYVDRSEDIKTVRGRIDFEQTLSDLLLYKGQLHCEYQEYSVNVPRNQIIATTLQRQARREVVGTRESDVVNLKAKVDRLVRTMDEIDRIGLELSLFANEIRKLGPNEREYKLMLLVCEMLYRPSMPLEDDTEAGQSFQDWIQKQKHDIFEKFVANFYKLRLDAWNVSAQTTLRWNEPHSPSDDNVVRLPTMRPDIVLEHKECKKRIVIDTKWYSNVVTDRHDQQTVHSSNLYQMYAYLASQDHRGKPHSNATGILLYAQTNEDRVDFRTKIDEHPFQVYTLNLTQDWQDIEDDLKTLLKPQRPDGV